MAALWNIAVVARRGYHDVDVTVHEPIMQPFCLLKGGKGGSGLFRFVGESGIETLRNGLNRDNQVGLLCKLIAPQNWCVGADDDKFSNVIMLSILVSTFSGRPPPNNLDLLGNITSVISSFPPFGFAYLAEICLSLVIPSPVEKILSYDSFGEAFIRTSITSRTALFVVRSTCASSASLSWKS